MKTTTRRRFTYTGLSAAFVGALFAAAAVASAETQPQGHRGSRGGPRDAHGRGPGALLKELDLSEEQRDQIRALGERSQSGGSFERVMEGREALNDAVESGADEGTIRQLAFDLGEAEGDAALERARMHGEMMQILTPEQQAEYQALKQEQKKKMEERKKRFEERRANRRDPAPDAN